MRRRRSALLLGAVLSLAGCASGPSYSDSVYRSSEHHFRTGPVPPEWRELSVSEALLAWRDDAAQATIAVNGRCGKDADDVPLAALVQHLFLYFTDRQVESEEAFPLDGREALRSQLLARLDGVQRRVVVVVLKKDGCVYDFLHIAPAGASPTGRARFDGFVRGFATLP